tara:strand:+ start:2914 stop:3123 length:210 start_codon:yes stop_codon:yes gene_type:complete
MHYFTNNESTLEEFDEIKKARVVKEATVKLKPLDEAIASGIVTVKKPKRVRKKATKKPKVKFVKIKKNK